MKIKQNIKKLLAGTLAVMMLSQTAVFQPAVFAQEPETPAAVEQTGVQLQNGTARIPADADEATVKQALFEALVANPEAVADPQSLTWEYYCTGKNGLLTNDAWGSINGFTSEKKVVFVPTTFTHPALAANEDGNYQVRLKGTDFAVTLTKVAKLSSSITLNEGCTAALVYNEDMSVNYDALRESIFNTVVASTTPELTLSDVTIEYYATATTGSVGDLGKAWVALDGGKSNGLTYPAISAGAQQIRISYAGTETVYGTSAETTVTITDRPEADITVNEAPAVKLAFTEDLQLDVDKLYSDMFSAIVASSTPELTLDDVTITYYATATTGSVGNAGKAWMPLEGGSDTVMGIPVNYPAIPAGSQQVRISWAGNQQYAPTTVEVTVQVADRDQLQFNLNEAPYEVGMVYDAQQGYDYAATAAAIRSAVIASTTPVIDPAEITVEYNADPTGITETFKPLDYTDLGGLVKFGTGEWKIRLSWDGNREYRGNSVVVTVTTTDNRAASTVVCKTGAAFTYNMDANAMKQAILDNVIDWEASELPAKETLTIDNFTFEYYGENLLPGNIAGGVKQWAPIEGGTVTLLNYPQMGAGERQIRVSYKGDANYRPSAASEATVTVNKAKVSVKVNSTNIYVGDQLPADFITTDPADTFDMYTVYAGVTSNVTTGLYLDLPDRYTDSAILKLLDPVVEKLFGKSFTQMMNDGVTLGELRQLFSTQELLDLLDKLHIDTGTFGQILSVINKLPSIADSVRVSFGTPNRAGLYTVAAVTDNPNYETGVGIGFVLVKMRLSGTKLTWNQSISGSLTAEQAKTFDFGATLSYNGDVSISQSNVHYLYTGFTSKWRLYSSTTTPPTEPGAYVMTVVTLGGDYLAAPITRTFTIK